MTRHFARNLVSLLALWAALIAPADSRACQVPVFRYALERWAPEPFELVIFHRGPFGQVEQSLIDSLAQASAAAGPANVQPTDVDVDARMDGALAKLWAAQGDVPLPWAVVRFPGDVKAPPAWAGRLDAPELKMLIDSPARRAIASRLIAGDSAVWVLLDGGDRAKDEAAAALLTNQLGKLEKHIKLPEPDPNVPAGERVLSDLPLRLAFPILRVSRNDPAEKPFVRLLLRGDKELLTGSDPVVIPIFGRGRALACLAGADLTADRIDEAGVFLAGDCSCMVKDLNPGYDLLMAGDWESILRGGSGNVAASRAAANAALAEAPRWVASAELPVSGARAIDRAASPAVAASSRAARRPLLIGGIVVMGAIVMVLGWVALRPTAGRSQWTRGPSR